MAGFGGMGGGVGVDYQTQFHVMQQLNLSVLNPNPSTDSACDFGTFYTFPPEDQHNRSLLASIIMTDVVINNIKSYIINILNTILDEIKCLHI